MENSIYKNAAASPNTHVALSNAVRENQGTGKLVDTKILNAMKERRNNPALSVRIREQYAATVANMQAAYDQAYA